MNDVKERNLPPGKLFAFHAMMVEADGIEPMRLIRDLRLVRSAVSRQAKRGTITGKGYVDGGGQA
jgi:hypothetical protein